MPPPPPPRSGETSRDGDGEVGRSFFVERERRWWERPFLGKVFQEGRERNQEARTKSTPHSAFLFLSRHSISCLVNSVSRQERSPSVPHLYFPPQWRRTDRWPIMPLPGPRDKRKSRSQTKERERGGETRGMGPQRPPQFGGMCLVDTQPLGFKPVSFFPKREI